MHYVPNKYTSGSGTNQHMLWASPKDVQQRCFCHRAPTSTAWCVAYLVFPIVNWCEYSSVDVNCLDVLNLRWFLSFLFACSAFFCPCQNPFIYCGGLVCSICGSAPPWLGSRLATSYVSGIMSHGSEKPQDPQVNLNKGFLSRIFLHCFGVPNFLVFLVGVSRILTNRADRQLTANPMAPNPDLRWFRSILSCLRHDRTVSKAKVQPFCISYVSQHAVKRQFPMPLTRSTSLQAHLPK